MVEQLSQRSPSKISSETTFNPAELSLLHEAIRWYYNQRMAFSAAISKVDYMKRDGTSPTREDLDKAFSIEKKYEDLLRRFTPPKKSKNTTKQCQCGNTQLALIQTQNLKWCPDCGTYIDWTKDEGQDDYY
jgi:hypothetical protein